MVELLRNSKVADFDVAARGQKDVGGLEVAVQHLALVDVLQGHHHLDEPIPDRLLAELLLLLLLQLYMVGQVALWGGYVKEF